MSNYEITAKLPSRGLLYGGEIDPNITLRHITTKEEKKLIASTSEDALDNLIKACIVSPKDLNLDDLLPADKHYLMMKLRCHTYGSDYHVEGTCPVCSTKKEYKINLDDFPIHELDDDFAHPLEFTLPVSQDKLKVRLLVTRDLNAVKRQAKKLSKTLKLDQSELEYVIRMAKHIVSINGEEVDEGSAQGYVEKMHARDSAYFWYKLDEVLIGYDTTIEVTCGKCHSDIEFNMPITGEFFRPRFD